MVREVNMIRVMYTKIGDISYISHLDIVKLMERISRRAGVRLAYSQGFSPHPKTSFSPALSVGMNSLCEFLDLELEDESIDLDKLLKLYNDASVDGIEFVKAKRFKENTKSIVAFLTHSVFEFDFKYYDDKEFDKIKLAVDEIKSMQEIILERTSKSGNKIQYDIRDMIETMEYQDKKILCLISTSSANNLNPRVLLHYIISLAGVDDDEIVIITKKDTFNMDDDKLIKRAI